MFGLMDALLDGGDEEDQSASGSPISPALYYAIGDSVRGNPFEEASVILAHHPSFDAQAADTWTWSVVKCTESFRIPSESEMLICVYRSLRRETGGIKNPIHLAELRGPGQLRAENRWVRTFPFPLSLRDKEYESGVYWSDEALEQVESVFDEQRQAKSRRVELKL